jgi:hypothetical protein
MIGFVRFIFFVMNFYKKKLAERLVNAKIDNTRNNIKANFEALGVGITFAIDITNKMVNMVADYFISDS